MGFLLPDLALESRNHPLHFPCWTPLFFKVDAVPLYVISKNSGANFVV